MKKMAKLLAVLLVLMLGMSTVASAGIMMPNVYVEDIKLSLYVPPYLTILTRDQMDDSLLAVLGMDRAAAVDYMVANQLYVDAFPSDVSYELTVAMQPLPGLGSFRDYGDAMLELLCDQVVVEYEKIGMTVTATDIYKNDEADFVKIYYNDPSSGARVVQYYTVVNDQAVHFRLFNYSGAITEADETILKSVVDNADFDS
ncbi:MAG: hypothetical protein IKK75_12405 [Clostridia bacterium]|nr:hypothetical protein [Clostridia bacterium]